MNDTRNILGKYAVPISAGVVVIVIALALLQHFLFTLGVVSTIDTFIDSIAMVAFGIVLGGVGTLATLNGTVRQAARAEESVRVLAAATPGVQVDETGKVIRA